MTDEAPRWKNLPLFRELFLQWRAARFGVESRTRDFSRDWEKLLRDAELTSAELRREADRDARTLADAGLVQLKTVRLRPYQIERIAIPLSAEPRLRALFADELPVAEEEKVDLAAFPWAVPLAFLREARTGIPFQDLERINLFLQQPRPAGSIPIKERSLQIFGDEKRLDALLITSLFRPDRLTLEHFRCHLVPEPLAWKRGRNPAGPIIVLENAATWESYCRWDATIRTFAAIVYGCGNRFRDGLASLPTIFDELASPRPILYFGDLDPQGIRIPLQAAILARTLGFPEILPHLWSYQHLLDLGQPQPSTSTDPLQPEDFAWFRNLAPRVEALLCSQQRLAQEHISWTFLQNQPSPPAVD